MPTYRIDGLGLEKPRVVQAPNPAAARQHVAAGLIVRKIEASDAFALAADGVKLEKVGEATEAAVGDGSAPDDLLRWPEYVAPWAAEAEDAQ